MSLFQNSLGFLPPYFGSGLGQRNFGFVKSAVAAANTYIVATGGTVIQSGDYKVHIFSATDNFIVTQLASNPTNNLLKVNVVAGGGGGGGYAYSGGGGAGGFIENLSYSLSNGTAIYVCTIGNGGAGGLNASGITNVGTKGGNSSFDSLVSIGGGGGGGFQTAPSVGGSGGGGSYTTSGANGTSGQGNIGGNGYGVGTDYRGGGGGGAGQVGQTSTSIKTGGNGGNGLLSSITGVYYAGGGGGGAGDVPNANYGKGGLGGGGGLGNATGQTNTGGGGAGMIYPPTSAGFNGGSGIIVISYYSPISLLTSFVDWYNQVLSNGGSLTTSEQTYINSFFYNLGTDFTEFDRLWIHGVSNAIAARTSLANPTSTIITNVNSVLFTANQGFTGNAVNNYLDTNYNLSTSAVKYTKNSASAFAYSRTSNQSPLCDFGAIGLTPLSITQLFIRNNSDAIVGDINSNNNTFGVNSNGTGFYSLVRTASNSSSIYKNGLVLSSGTTASVLPPYNLYLLCRNVAGTATLFGNRQISVSGTSSGVVNQLNFYNAIQMLGGNLLWAV